MAQFNFPSSPSNGDSFTQNGVTFQWDGEAWRRQGVAGAQGSAGAPVSYTHLTLPTKCWV